MDQWEDEELSVQKFGEDDLDEILEEELFMAEADEEEILRFQSKNAKQKSLGTFGDLLKARGYGKSKSRKKA